MLKFLYIILSSTTGDIRQKITARYEGAGQLQEKFGGITYETGTRRIYIDVRTDVRIDP